MISEKYFSIRLKTHLPEIFFVTLKVLLNPEQKSMFILLLLYKSIKSKTVFKLMSCLMRDNIHTVEDSK